MTDTSDAPTYHLYGMTVQSRFPFRFGLERAAGPADLQFVYHGVAAETVPPGRVVYNSLLKNQSGQSVVRLYRGEEEETVVFPGIAAFRCGPDRIDAWAYLDGLEYLVEICLIGNVMSYWLERRGICAIHASAVVIAGHAVGFIAGTSRGKTTTACSFLAAGYPLLTDDILPLTLGNGRPTAWPGFPQMKLLPEQLQLLGADGGGLEKVHPLFDKLLAPIGNGIGRYHRRSVPLGCIYLLDRTPAGRPTLVPITQGTALIELVKHSFAAELMDAVDRGPERLARLAQIARAVPLKRIRIPAGYDRLGEVPALVAEDASLWSTTE